MIELTHCYSFHKILNNCYLWDSLTEAYFNDSLTEAYFNDSLKRISMMVWLKRISMIVLVDSEKLFPFSVSHFASI